MELSSHQRTLLSLAEAGDAEIYWLAWAGQQRHSARGENPPRGLDRQRSTAALTQKRSINSLIVTVI